MVNIYEAVEQEQKITHVINSTENPCSCSLHLGCSKLYSCLTYELNTVTVKLLLDEKMSFKKIVLEGNILLSVLAVFLNTTFLL